MVYPHRTLCQPSHACNSLVDLNALVLETIHVCLRPFYPTAQSKYSTLCTVLWHLNGYQSNAGSYHVSMKGRTKTRISEMVLCWFYQLTNQSTLISRVRLVTKHVQTRYNTRGVSEMGIPTYPGYGYTQCSACMLYTSFSCPAKFSLNIDHIHSRSICQVYFTSSLFLYTTIQFRDNSYDYYMTGEKSIKLTFNLEALYSSNLVLFFFINHCESPLPPNTVDTWPSANEDFESLLTF